MAKGPGGRTPGGKPSGAKLGSGSKGRQAGNVKGSPGNIGSANISPALSGNPDVVQRNLNAAKQGAAEKTQLRKNRSTGIKPGKK